jgi:hypothetical protein
MTNHDEPPRLPPPPPGYDAEEAAFASFANGYRPLADDLNSVTGASLAAHTTLDGNAFSRVGNEVGLSNAIRTATQRQLDRVNGLAGTTTTMADAVGQTWTNYVDIEDEHDERMRRTIGEIT